MPYTQLASVSSIDVTVTCNKQAAPMATACLKMEDVQAKLATLVNETLLGVSPAGTALPAGCLLLVSIPDTQLGTFGPGDLTEACFGNIPNDPAFACLLVALSRQVSDIVRPPQASCLAVWLYSGMQLTQCVVSKCGFCACVQLRECLVAGR